jgi:Rrf2 family nitric oxide-sensitive transcriptional repressor
MRLSSYSDYALRVLMHAALRQPRLTTIDEVAGAFNISRHHLSKVVYALALHGFLSTQRGIGGGFTLARFPAEISVGEIVRLTEGDESVVDCANRHNQRCTIFPACRLKGVLAEAAAAFFGVLDRYSLEDLVKKKTQIQELLGIAI